jgi:iron complex transport system permease protein
VQQDQARFLFAPLSIRSRLTLITALLAGGLALAAILAAGSGPVPIPYGDVARLTLRGMGLPVGLDLPGNQLIIISQVRLPRVLVGALVGAALACSGAALQGIFRNPLAEPGIVGISAGSALGAVVALTTGIGLTTLWAVPMFAFAGGMGTAMLVYTLSLVRGQVQPATLLLAGIAVGTLLGAITTALLLLTQEFIAVQAILGWLVGGLRGRGWAHLQVIAGPILVALALLQIMSRDLNLLLMGEESAQGLGIDVPRTRLALLALLALATSTAVSVSGPISFVGLIVPHILRLIVGPDYRILLPASALGGAIFLVLADALSRLVLQPAELQVGVVTSLLGAPFFLFLLIRSRKSYMTF